MLRLLVLFLILANGLYFAWSDGWLRPYGYGPSLQSEPHRLAQQLHPDSVRVLTASEVKRVEAQVQADLLPKECLQAGPLDEAQSAVVRRALEAALEPASWRLETVAVSARWIVYMGKFANAEAMAKKRSELAVMNIVPQALVNPDLELGFSLGAFDNQAAAMTELNRLMTQRGIRTAKVVQERAQGQQSQLRLPAITAEQKARLHDVRTALGGHPLRPCN